MPPFLLSGNHWNYYHQSASPLKLSQRLIEKTRESEPVNNFDNPNSKRAILKHTMAEIEATMKGLDL